MKKLSVLAILAVAMVSVSSAFTNSDSTAPCVPAASDTTVAQCPAPCPNAAQADTVKAAQNDSVR